MAVCWPILASSVGTGAELEISPTEIRLDRPEGSQQILVTRVDAGRREDVTRQAAFHLDADAPVSLSPEGLARPVADGQTTLVVRYGDLERRVEVVVDGMAAPTPVSFVYEIQPLLTKARCNSGGCHGKAEGQNGFKLSLLGFDARSDYTAIAHEGRSRRISRSQPEASLLVSKATAATPHGGGRKIDPGSPQHRRLLRWIAEGARDSVKDEQPVVRIEVEPSDLVLGADASQQLRVTAIDAAGLRRCATIEADYLSNAPHIVDADGRGLLTSGRVPGEASILVRFLGHVAVVRAAVPRPGTPFARPPERNFIDGLVWNKLERLGIPASPPADDAMFLRRVYLDVIGTLPTAAEARAFLEDRAPDKRDRLVERLLLRPEYADYWSMKWSDILRVDKIKITSQGAVGLSRWLRRQMVENRPYDEFVAEIVTAQGPVQSESPAALFKALDTPEVAGRAISQVFLGVRIECAQCHHHPSERWSQEDYAAFAGLLTGVTIKKLPGGGESIVSATGKDLPHPRTGEPVPARPLGAPPPDFTTADRRQALAGWMTGPENPFVGRAIVNRLWAHYFGRGLVDPVDDLRVTNPATNEPLMAALVEHLHSVRYDLRAFTTTLLTSQAYQLSSRTLAGNVDDQQHVSHARLKTLPAEVLLDALNQAAGVDEKFAGWPAGVRAIQVWDNRMPSYFFRIFGRPARATVCECERSNEPSITQALHLMNSPEVQEKLSDRRGLCRRLADSDWDVNAILDEIYLGTLSRFPTEEERTLLAVPFASESRRQAVEDVLWTVLNTKEFLFTH